MLIAHVHFTVTPSASGRAPFVRATEALDVGDRPLSAFNAAFRELTGKSPG